MSKKLRVLFAGESWTTTTTHIKGLDSFTQHGYGEGVKWVREALEKGGMEVVHMPCHKAITDFPGSVGGLAAFDCIILSDMGSNTLLLHPDTTVLSLATFNRLEVIREYVENGGSLVMAGGYMSFQGIEGKARYHGTAIEDALPVEILPYDDRMEMPQGFRPYSVSDHEVLKGIPREFPEMLFYNKLIPKVDSSVLLMHGQDPILTVRDYGKGRSAAFAPDVAPHGATQQFLEWEYFNIFWQQLIKWLCRREAI